jgi:hypothetical protein
MKLIKGNTYLVLIQETTFKKTGWIVQQTGQKSWVATRFTNATQDYMGEYTVLFGNALKLVVDLEAKCNNGEVLQVVATDNTVQLRKYMFNILKYGTFEEN